MNVKLSYLLKQFRRITKYIETINDLVLKPCKWDVGAILTRVKHRV